VVRLHLLIFFFAAVHFAQLESFAVYAIVYAVYFFPWRLVIGPAAQGTGTPADGALAPAGGSCNITSRQSSRRRD
jgi:hypothetical protein